MQPNHKMPWAFEGKLQMVNEMLEKNKEDPFYAEKLAKLYELIIQNEKMKNDLTKLTEEELSFYKFCVLQHRQNMMETIIGIKCPDNEEKIYEKKKLAIELCTRLSEKGINFPPLLECDYP